MYAIIQTGGKQYRVENGTRLSVEKLPQELGAEVQIPEVLLINGDNGSNLQIGQPFVANSKVVAKVVRHFRADKVIIFKKRSKKGYKKIQGHRQNLTEIEVKEISL
ncbi:MAG: 50S ribosomal protein L21 [Elusimicrobia bacterium]|nr:50S ribosomal protein L21 [Elusimicrobiota bacterium]